MNAHEPPCAIELGYNHCTCIRYAEQTVARGYELHMRQAGERHCVGGHEEWWLGTHTCPWCKAVV